LKRGNNFRKSQAETITTNFIKRNNAVIDIDMLTAIGMVKQEILGKHTTFAVTITESVSDLITAFNTKNGVSYAGAFSVSVDLNFDTKKTENRTSKFIKAMGQVRIKDETILNTSLVFLKDFLTEQFKKDCADKTANDMLAIYGSHVIVDCHWGGIATAEAMYTSTKITDNTKLEAIVKGSFGNFSASNTTTSTQEREHFQKNTTEKISAWGGNLSAMSWADFTKKYDSWYTSLTASNSAVCGIDRFNEKTNMIPLWDFVNLVLPTKATQIKTEFNKNCTDRGVKLKGHVIYAPVMTDLNVFSASSNYTYIPSPYNRVVLEAFADRENNTEAFVEKTNQILDCNKHTIPTSKKINIFYTTRQMSNYNDYTGRAISDIFVISGGILNSNPSIPSGYTRISIDLNEKAGGDYLYLVYRKATASDTEVIDFIGGIIYDKDFVGNLPARDDGRWEWVTQRDKNGKFEQYADLNKGCGVASKYIRLLVHKIPRQR